MCCVESVSFQVYQVVYDGVLRFSLEFDSYISLFFFKILFFCPYFCLSCLVLMY